MAENENLNQTDTTTDQDKDKGRGTDDKGGNTPETISMSSADLAKRLERQAKSARAALLKELGIESVEALKEKLTTTDQQVNRANEATQSELDAIKAELAKVSAYAAKSQQEAETLKADQRSKAVMDVLRSTVEVMRLRKTVAEDLLGWATVTRRDTSKLLKDDLTPDTAALDAFIKEARTERPDWFPTARVGSPSIAGLPPTEADQKRKQAAADAQWSALKRGG
jgi:hypothetical protein